MVTCRRSTFLLVSTLPLASLVAASCGGGGGGSAAQVRAAAVAATFPTAHCLTDDRTLTVRGTTADPANVGSLEVDGVPARTFDGFATWSAEVAVANGTSKLRVAAFDGAGRALAPIDLTVDFATLPVSPTRPALDPKRQQLLVGEQAPQPFGVVALDLASGRWIEVSGPHRGSGPLFPRFDGFAVDAAADVAYGYTFVPFRVVAFDLATGIRRLVSDDGSPGTQVRFPRDLALDLAHGRLLTCDINPATIVAIDLDDGSRSVLSDETHGIGPVLGSPEALHVVESQGRLLVVDDSLGALLSVDLATGDRSIISDFDRGAGTAFVLPGSVTFEPSTGDALVVDRILGALLRVDLLTGDRTVVSDATHGGPLPETLSKIAGELDPSGRALVVDGLADLVYAIDLATGDRADLGRIRVGEATPLGSVATFALDAATGHLLVAKLRAVPALIDVDPTTGRRTLVSSDDRGTGPTFVFGVAVAVAPTLRRAYVSEVDAILEVDLATGNRRVLTGDGVGSGPEFDVVEAIAIDEESGTALVVDRAGGDAALISVDLATGDRSEVSGPNRGNGDRFFCPEAVALDPDGVTAYVSDRCQATLFRIDRVSGDRAIVSNGSIGGGPALELPCSGLSLDPDGRHAFVGDSELGIVRVDLVTGDRVVASGPGTGHGPQIADLGVLDARRGRFFARPKNTASLLEVDLATGDRAIVSY